MNSLPVSLSALSRKLERGNIYEQPTCPLSLLLFCVLCASLRLRSLEIEL